MNSQVRKLILIGILGVSPFCYAQTEGADTSMEEVKKETQELLEPSAYILLTKEMRQFKKQKRTSIHWINVTMHWRLGLIQTGTT